MGNTLIGKKDNGSSYKVLLIDDSVFVIKRLSKILELQGFEIVATAEDGEKGIEQYKTFYPNIDLVMLDITMPNVDGMETLKRILEFDKDAKILMVSALGKEELIKEALIIGAKSFVTKPVEEDKIIPKIQQILNRK